MTDPIDRPNPPIRTRPPVIGAAVAPTVAPGRPAPVPRERLVPKPLQRVLGFIILLSTVGMLSCQAFLD